MTVSLITPQYAMDQVAASLSLPARGSPTGLTPELIAQALRRAVQIMGPCATHELSHAVSSSLAELDPLNRSPGELVEATLESLIVYGDILEMRVGEADGWNDRAFLLRPAPPSFVKRSDGSIVLLGVAGDEITALTPSLAAKVSYRETLRIVAPASGEDHAAQLREIGLLELPERVWLRIPRQESASDHLGAWRLLLEKQPESGVIDGLLILDTARSPLYYRDRWSAPANAHSGMYVARRPQRYGAGIWCLAEVDQGVTKSVLDLASPADRMRPCDVAWRIQMAADACALRPQQYRCRAQASVHAFEFFSPLPSWAERRLALVGEKSAARGSLFSYLIPGSSAETEHRFLRDALWLAQQDNPG